MRRVGVLIPYYQRDRGLLRKALDSVAAQSLRADVRLVVVIIDDSSPLPATDELSDYMLPASCELTVLRQPNGGPGAARNAGLEHLASKSVDFVAFLDSDDVWRPDHLAAALGHLDACDFYFANILEESAETDWFSYSSYIAHHHTRQGVGDYSPETRLIDSDEAFRALLDDLVPPTPQVVYRWSCAPDLRFDSDLRRAGEDRLFWLSLCRRCKAVCYSTKVQGRRGAGISVHRGTFSWDSPYGPDRLIDTLISRDRAIRRLRLNADEMLVLRPFLERTRTHLTFLIVRHLRENPAVAFRSFRRLIKELPSFFLYAPISLLRIPRHYLQLRREYAEKEGTSLKDNK